MQLLNPDQIIVMNTGVKTTGTKKLIAGAVQSELNQIFQRNMTAVDGWYGSGTAGTVAQFQKASSLTANGKLDVKTFYQLESIYEQNNVQSISISMIFVASPAAGGRSQTITSVTLNPITQASINEAKGLLNSILDEYHPNEWPSGYSIGNKTWSAEYKNRYQKAVDRTNDVASFFNYLDLIEDISKTYGELSETGVSDPYTLAVSSVLVGAWRNQADKEPGFAELPDTLGISGSLTKNIAKAKEKSDFIDNSNYKYLVYSGQFLWEKGPRGMFIDNITNLEGTVKNRTETRYNNAQDNTKYKQEVLNYLGVIKNMNVKYKQTVSDMNYLLKKID